MNDKSDTRRLAEAVATITTTITEIIEFKIRELGEAPKASAQVRGGSLTPAEGWVGRRRRRRI